MGETRPAFLVKIVLLTSRVDSSPYHSASTGANWAPLLVVLLCLCGVGKSATAIRLLKSLQIRFREATVHGSLVPDSWRSRNDTEAV